MGFLPYIRASILTLGLVTAVASRATLITFEGLPGGTGAPGDVGQIVGVQYDAPLTTQGYVFSGSAQFATYIPIAATNTTYANYTGSAALFSQQGNPTTVAASGGGTFSLLNLDLANLRRQSASAGGQSVTFTGILARGGTVTQTYAIPADDALHTVTFSGFTGLSSFTMASTSIVLPNPYQFDNVNVQAVPEPMPLAVFGLGVLGLLRRRRP